jgi:hypothetical protein
MSKYTYNRQRLFMMSLLTILLANLITGCSKMIEIDLPHDKITTEAAFVSNEQATSVIASIYSQMMNNTGNKVYSNGGITLYAGLSADELESYIGVANPFDDAFYTNKLLYDNPVPNTTIWTPAYKVIFDCNAAIEGITNSTSLALDAATRSELIGEAKFIRAFTYFYLVNLFGDIPMPLVTDFNVTAHLSRTPVADVYVQIIADLKDAQGALRADFSISPKVTTVDDRVRANKFAATALLARVYLYTKDWANAEAQATQVINSPLFSPGTLDNIFLKNSSETILAFKQNVTKVPYGGTHDANSFVPTTLMTSFPAATIASLVSSSATYSATSLLFFPTDNMTVQLSNAFETADLRKTKWTQNWPSPIFPPYNGRTFYTPNKYKYKTTNSASTVNNEYYIVLRLSEQYLIRAEARANLNNLTGAASDLTPLRSRANLGNIPTTSQAQVLDAIARERQIELFAEWGHRWLDLKRTGKVDAVLGAIGEKQYTPTQQLYPIPAADIKNNPKLTQNPGYN